LALSNSAAPSNELVGHAVLNAFYEADREAILRHVAVCFAHLGRTMSWEFRKDGTGLRACETAKAMLMKNRPVVLIVCEDITRRKCAEEELKKTAQRLRAWGSTARPCSPRWRD
jgi:PAS domain S-box-containing protein